MCGIYAYIGNNSSAGQIVLHGLKKLEYRGYDSWGIAIKTGAKFTTFKKTGQISQATPHLPLSTTAIGHTRWATHGKVTQKNSHPHFGCTKKLTIVHNGVIENYQQIKNSLKNNHKYTSQTDTEVFIHLVEELSAKHPIAKAMSLAFSQIKGLNAFVCLDLQSQKIIIVKNGSPIVIGRLPNAAIVASDSNSLLDHTRKVVFLQDNQLATINSKGIINVQTLSGTPIQSKSTILPPQTVSTTKGAFPHYTLKEIHQQPDIISHLLEHKTTKINNLKKLVNTKKSIIFTGCGTAYYAALAAKYLFSDQTQIPTDALLGSEFDHFSRQFNKQTLAIMLSQSGETADILQPSKHLKNRHIKIAAITNTLGSSLYRIADQKTLLDAGPEIAVVSTKAFTAKLTILSLLAASLSNHPHQHQTSLAIRSIRRILTHSYFKTYIKPVVNLLSKHKHIFVLGRGVNYPIALEIALKIKESSYIHAEAFSSGELKHGVIALIDKGTPCIFLVPSDNTFTNNIIGAQEVNARGGTIIGISEQRHNIFDYHLPVAAKTYAILPNTVIGQLLGYYLALAYNRNPDKPRNLAKSVTVK